MKLLLILTCSILFSAKSEFNVKGMVCAGGCANKIKMHINSLDGVSKCDIDFDKSLLTVEYDESKMDDSIILKTINEKTTYSCSAKNNEEPKGFFKRIFSWF